MESAGQKEELSHSTTGDQLWELTITNPKEKNLQQEILHSVPNREKYTSHLPEEPRYIPATQPRKRVITLNSHFSPMHFLLKQSFPTYYFSL